jgi:hypothetical protein
VEWLTRADVDRDPDQAAQVHRVVAAVAELGGAVGWLTVPDRAECETLILDVRGNNHGALRLYESFGFQEYGRLPDFIAVGHHRFDRVLLRKELSRPAGVLRHGDRAEGPGASLTRSGASTDDTARSTMAGRPGT